FLAAALALAGSPGPNTLSLAAIGAAYGWRRGRNYLIGLSLGMALVIALVGSGVTGLVFLVPGARPAVIAIASAYFIWLAWKIATAPPLGEAGGNASPPGPMAAVLVSLTNP